MTATRSRNRRRTTPVFALFVMVYEPEQRGANIRIILEGPFTTSEEAVTILTALLKDDRYSAAASRIVRFSSSKRFYATTDRTRSLMDG